MTAQGRPFDFHPCVCDAAEGSPIDEEKLAVRKRRTVGTH